MVKKWSIRHCGLLVVVIVVSGLLLAGLIKAVVYKGVESGEAASWMQALGSIAAISVAIWLSQERESADYRQAVQSSRMFHTRLVEAVAELRHACESQSRALLLPASHQIEDVLLFGRNLRVELLPGERQITVFKARAIASEARSLAEDIRTTENNYGYGKNQFESMRKRARKASLAFEGIKEPDDPG
jgi:hypothetical protein